MYFSVHKYISQCTNAFLSAQIYFSVHKSISQCTNVFLSAQIYFSVHKCISQCKSFSQCTNLFLSTQIYFSVYKYISQSTNVFLSAKMYFSVHKSISQCTNVFLSAWLHGFPAHLCCSVGTFCSCHLPCKSIGLSLVSRPVRAIRVIRGGLEPSVLGEFSRQA